MKKAIIIQAISTLAAYLVFCFLHWQINPARWTWTGTSKGDWVLISDISGRAMIVLILVMVFLIGGMCSVPAWSDYKHSKKKK